MKLTWLAGLAALVLPAAAQAHGFGGWRIGFGFGIAPTYYAPAYCGPTYRYSSYCPPPVTYYAPPPVVYSSPAPVYAPPVYDSAPTYYAPPPVYYSPPPVVYSQPYFSTGIYIGGGYRDYHRRYGYYRR